jgi:hypothetical protein
MAKLDLYELFSHLFVKTENNRNFSFIFYRDNRRFSTKSWALCVEMPSLLIRSVLMIPMRKRRFSSYFRFS